MRRTSKVFRAKRLNTVSQLLLLFGLMVGAFSGSSLAQSSGLVFYDPTDHGAGARITTARVENGGTVVFEKTIYGFSSTWTHVSMAHNNVILFYNAYTGAAATGALDANGNYVNYRNLTLNPHWWKIVAVGPDKLFFLTAPITSGPWSGAVARVDNNGNFTTLWSSSSFGRWTEVAGTISGFLLFYDQGVDNGAIGQVTTDGRFVTLRTGMDLGEAPGGPWYRITATNTCASTCASMFFFYDGNGHAKSGYVDWAGNFGWLRDLGSGFYPALSTNENKFPGPPFWEQVLATYGGFLLFDECGQNAWGPGPTCTGTMTALSTGYLDTSGAYHNLVNYSVPYANNILSSVSGTY
jgi:hypothetical protein